MLYIFFGTYQNVTIITGYLYALYLITRIISFFKKKNEKKKRKEKQNFIHSTSLTALIGGDTIQRNVLCHFTD